MNPDRSAPKAASARNRRLLCIVAVASCGGFLFGYDLSLIGAANVFLREQFHLSAEAFGFATASACIGCMLGPVLGFWLCDAVGRERTMMVAAFILAVGAIMTAVATTMFTFNLFRIVGGVGVGLCSIASPMYIAEIAPSRRRGSLGVIYQLAIVVGCTAAPLVAYFLVSGITLPVLDDGWHLRKIWAGLPDTLSWRYMFGSQMAVIVLFAGLLFLLPKSPRWLAQRGRFAEALEVLRQVDDEAHAQQELDEIKRDIKQETGSLAELAQPGLRRALLIGLLLAFFNNWTGWSAMGGFIPRLLELAGLESRSLAILQFALTYLAMAVVTIIAILTVDRLGRRPLWLWASLAMAVITAVTGLVFHLHLHGGVVLLVLALCTVPHGIALGPLPWLMTSEIFPTHLRAKLVAITTTFVWLAIFTSSWLFPMIGHWSQQAIGSEAGAFWVFTVVCLLSFWFGWKLLPETKGRTLEEIGRSWNLPKPGDPRKE